MTQEEKAKAYDEAYKKVAVRFGSNVADEIFPELKESEDDKIRKDMIETIKKEAHDFPSSVIAEKSNSWIAWLEKQGEQKPADNVDVLMSLDEAIEHCKEKSCGNNACALEHKQLEKWLTELKELKEQKSAWSEEDERKINYLIALLQNSTMNDDALRVMNEEVENWLKSLKYRYTWKPSETQLETLKELSHDVPTKRGVIEELLKQLKQL